MHDSLVARITCICMIRGLNWVQVHWLMYRLEMVCDYTTALGAFTIASGYWFPRLNNLSHPIQLSLPTIKCNNIIFDHRLYNMDGLHCNDFITFE